MMLDVAPGPVPGITTREILGMIVVGAIILVVWLAFRNLHKLEKGDD